MKKLTLPRLSRTSIVCGCIVLILLTLWVVYGRRNVTNYQKTNAIIARLQQKSSTLEVARVTDRTQAYPTNTWFSGLVFSKDPVPVYTYPLSYKPTATGYEVGYTAPKADADVIQANHNADIICAYQSNVDGVVQKHDDLSVQIGHTSGAKQFGTARLTEGSPYIYGVLKANTTLTITTPLRISGQSPHTAIFQNDNKTFGIWSEAELAIQGNSIRLLSGKESRYSIFVVPKGLDHATLFALAPNYITGTSVTYSKEKTDLTTSYKLTTNRNGNTLWGQIDQATNASAVKGSLPTLIGTQHFVEGTAFQTKVQAIYPQDTLPLDKLSSAEINELKMSVARDSSTMTFDKSDTYYAGKQLYRAANLLKLSAQLNDTKTADMIASQLGQQLSLWLDPGGGFKRENKYFYYDKTIKGIVGKSTSFGSEHFNDHHFHYGYIVYAAAALQSYNHSLNKDQRQVVTLLARDIANPSADDYFPKLRVFDMYAGHSWASGYGAFGDGNNQESSSEAVNAWAAIYAWTTLERDSTFQLTALWLYNREASAANTLWLNTPYTGSKGYVHPFASLLWGGKIEFATWFSAEPSAKLAIQLIPLSPSHTYIADPASIARNLQAVPESSLLFPDYLAMYQALIDKDQALMKLRGLPASSFDDANSKSYALAWALSRGDSVH